MTPPLQTAIVDFGLGNLYSVERACAAVGLQSLVTSCRREILAADAILLPGVGAFGDAMRALARLDLVGPLREAALSGKPFVGVCLGMQLLLSESTEFGRHRGLNLLEGDVVRFERPLGLRGPLKVPQIGWNAIHRPAAVTWHDSPLECTADGTPFYFVHSFYAVPANPADVQSTTRYGDLEFCSAVRRENIIGFQFHPERSGPAGLQIYAKLAEFIRRYTHAGEGCYVA